jgi:pimeloyl-ACP methyl ester carboxylesterase
MEETKNLKESTINQTEFPKCTEISERSKSWKKSDDTNSVILHSRIMENQDSSSENHLDCVILHGLFSNGNHFKSLTESILKACKQIKRIILIDLRNHGASDHHDSMTYIEMMEDVNRHLVSLSVSNFILIGHSMGAKTAMHYCQKYGKNLRGIITIDTYPKDYKDYPEIWQSQLKLIEFLNTINLNDYKKENFLEFLSKEVVNLI